MSIALVLDADLRRRPLPPQPVDPRLRLRIEVSGELHRRVARGRRRESYPPNPRNADPVNRRGALVERARRCERLRDRTANLLAVDFAERGDVVGAAAELNGQT